MLNLNVSKHKSNLDGSHVSTQIIHLDDSIGEKFGTPEAISEEDLRLSRQSAVHTEPAQLIGDTQQPSEHTDSRADDTMHR